jgi:hypothetical protein
VVLERRGARLALVLVRLERGVHLLGADGLDLCDTGSTSAARTFFKDAGKRTSSFTFALQWLYTVGALISIGSLRTIIAVRGAVRVRAGTKLCTTSGAAAKAAAYRSFIRRFVQLLGVSEG